jgi:signal transduction histidine kinase
VTVAFVDAGPARAKHRDATTRMAAIGLGALVLGSLLAWLLAGRMLKPVRDAAAAAEAIERLEQRLPERAAPGGRRDELSRLVAVLNGMLARLEEAADRERLFLATASHELRRPLTALLGELELARREGRDAQSLRASVSLASEDAQAMKRLVDDLLRHARAQAGTLRLSEGRVDLVELVVEAVERSRRTLPGSLRVRVGELPNVTLSGDADALREVLENLLVNAGVHGGSDVTVAVGAEVRGGEVLVHVDDDGEGISADDMARIFEPFSRGDRTRSVPGFGLGLAIARDTAEAHGGRLTATSPLHAGSPRPGSRFTLHLPSSRVVDPG